MQKRNKLTTAGIPARPVVFILGLAVCFAILSVLSSSFAQRAVRTPGAGPPEVVAPRQQTAQITTLMISFLQNRADTRLSDIGSTTYRRGNWMRILIGFTTQPDWIDEVRFDCYVLLRDGNETTMLTGSVTCMYVAAGRQHVASLFVHPSTMERYGRRVEAVGVECYHQNSVVSDYSVPRTTRKWWQDYTGIPDTLVSWFFTPFLRDGAERYEQVRTPTPRF